MEGLSRVEAFDWDDGNRIKNWVKHGVSSQECEEVFYNAPTLLVPDTKHSQKEKRFVALGKTSSGRALTVVFTLRSRGTLIRIISARNQSMREYKSYKMLCQKKEN